MATIHDLRNYLRLDGTFDVRFKILPEGSGEGHRAQALDIGAGGVKIFSETSLAPDMRLELTFYIHPKNKDRTGMIAVGRVIWCREVKMDSQGLDRYEVGIRFEEIDPKDRDQIFQYVYRKLAAQDRVRELVRRVQL